jgi:2,3,4,5-tetrahydropyridine-2,6-dicarboxylate N-succinyltransferase
VNLEQQVDRLSAEADDAAVDHDAYRVIDELLLALESGELRAARCDETGAWQAVPWVKRGILLAFRLGRLVDMSPAYRDKGRGFSFVDKHTLPPRQFAERDGVRIVPGGSMIRRGAYVARGVVCMPPMYVNVGAHVGSETMIDSHALVGSCAQVGERVHLSAAAQIGGVLEPVNATPVIVEDDVLVGGNCGVYEGTIVRNGAVLAAGVVLTRGTPVFDLVNERVIRADAGEPLEIPPGAVVVPGARAVTSPWGREHSLSLQTPVIVKYRDEKTDTATALESWLR